MKCPKCGANMKPKKLSDGTNYWDCPKCYNTEIRK